MKMQVLNSLPFTGFCSILLFLIIKIRLLKKKEIKVSSEKKIDKVSLLLYFIFGFIFILWFFEITKPAFRFNFLLLPELLTKNLIENKFLKIAGAILILFSIIMWAITLVYFKNSLRFGLDEKNSGSLITTGIFSFTRNPFFLSLNIYFLGTALIFSCFYIIGFSILAFVGIHFFILREEKFMLKVYGERYKIYAQKVRRYF